MGREIENNHIYWNKYYNFKKQNYDIGQIVGLEWYKTATSSWATTTDVFQPKLDIYYSYKQVRDGTDPITSTSSKNVFVEFSFCWADLVLAFKGINQTTHTDPFSHKPYYAGNFGDFNTLMTTPVSLSVPDSATLRSIFNFKLKHGSTTRYLTIYDYTIDSLNCIVRARGELLYSKTRYV